MDFRFLRRKVTSLIHSCYGEGRAEFSIPKRIHLFKLMHILIIHQAFASLDEPGGTRHYEFARLLAAHGHKVTIIASPVSYITGSISIKAPAAVNHDHKNIAGDDGTETDVLTILRARVYSAHHKSFFHRIIAFFSFMISSFIQGLNVKDVDLVWGTSPPIFQGVTAWWLARIKRVPFLLEVRDLWPLFAVAVGVLKNPFLIASSKWLEKTLYKKADAIMVNSPGFIPHIRQLGGKKIELVPNGADPAMFDPSNDGAAFRRAYGIDHSFVVLYAGAHGASNDLNMVLDAALQVSDPDIQIMLLGDGKEKTALQRKAARMELKNVKFLPSIPKSEMPAVLAGTDACLAVLKPLEEYKTTYPNKVFDYMAAGRPVILAIDGVIREVVEAAGCGLFVQPGNPAGLAEAIHKLAKDPEHSRRMGLAGRAYLETHFNRTEIAGKLIKILENLK